MPPIDLLCALLLLTAAAGIIHRQRNRRHEAVFRDLAVENHMHYSPRDSLRLTPRVATLIPLPGASAVKVVDLLYRTDEQLHHYVFTAEYTVGVTGPKHRIRRAAAFTESKTTADSISPIRLAPEQSSLLEQYQTLVAGNSKHEAAKPSIEGPETKFE
jgi:hypothetical protein